MAAINPILAQKLGLTQAPPVAQDAQPATPMRQMRRALARAADKAAGLSVSVLGISDEDLDAESLIEGGPEGWVVLGLRDGLSAGLTGLFLLDQPLRSALVEMQTMGSLLPISDDQRRVTRVDAVMTMPFASQVLAELAEVGFGAADFETAAYDIGPIDDLRTAGLVMVQGNYRIWRIAIQMGGGEAQGEMMIAMRPKVSVVTPAAKDTSGWSEALRKAVQDAPAELDAILTRMTMPIHKIEEFEVGQVLNLAGTTVGSVTLIGPGGDIVTTARLGQVAGKRAVRVQHSKVELQDDPPNLAAPAPAKGHVAAVVAPEMTDPNITASDLVEG
jgi:flagellar motor switch protein FliM